VGKIAKRGGKFGGFVCNSRPGNPGAKYENTRHNVGFDTVEFLSKRHDIRLGKLKHKALIGDGEIGGRKVILAKPQTFMNLSGEVCGK